MVALLRAGALCALLGAVAGAGCTGVSIRPDGSPAEEKCPQGARESMAAFGLRPGASTTIHVDATRTQSGPLIVYDGPIESRTWLNMADLPGHTRLVGRVWTGGPRVVIRYYSARLPDGKVIPFCAVAAENRLGLEKSPGRAGFAAIQSSTAFVEVTGEFR